MAKVETEPFGTFRQPYCDSTAYASVEPRLDRKGNMPKFTRKSETLTAARFDGTLESIKELGLTNYTHYVNTNVLHIPTPRGTMTLRMGDWLTRNEKDELREYKDGDFQSLYDVDENPIWLLTDALALIRLLQPECMKVGYYLAMAGSVLNYGESKSDLDIVAVSRRERSNPITMELQASLSGHMRLVSIKEHPGETHLMYTYGRKVVEVSVIHRDTARR